MQASMPRLPPLTVYVNVVTVQSNYHWQSDGFHAWPDICGISAKVCVNQLCVNGAQGFHCRLMRVAKHLAQAQGISPEGLGGRTRDDFDFETTQIKAILHLIIAQKHWLPVVKKACLLLDESLRAQQQVIAENNNLFHLTCASNIYRNPLFSEGSASPVASGGLPTKVKQYRRLAHTQRYQISALRVASRS